MSPAKPLALTGVIVAGVLAIPFFVVAAIGEIFDDGASRMLGFFLWFAAAIVGLLATIALYRTRDWASVGLAATGGIMILVPVALALWQDWPEAVWFAIPGLLLGVAGLIPQDEGADGQPGS